MKKRIIIFVIIIVIVALIGGTYAWFTTTKTASNTNTIVAGSLTLVINDEKNAIDINPAIPVTDDIGTTYTPYTFNITNTGTISAKYTIYIDNDESVEGDRISDNLIRYELKKNSDSTTINTFNSNRIIIDNVDIEPNKTDSYELKLWIDEDATTDINGKVFAGKLRIVGTQKQR